MKKIIYYLCIVLVITIVLPACTRVANTEMSQYQRKNIKNFSKKKGKAKKEGSHYHPAVKKEYGTRW